MTDEELDLMMQKVLTDAAELDCAPEASDGTFTPSRSHEREMRSMLLDPDGWARKRSRPVWKKALQAAAVIVVALLVGFGGLMAVSPEARAAVNRWITDEGEGYVTYTYSGDDYEKLVMPRYVISALPEDYVEIAREEFPTSILIEYENDEGTIIGLSYDYMHQGGMTGFITGDDDIIDVKIGNLPGKMFVPKDPDSVRDITWIDPKANIQFVLYGFIDEDTLLELAQSVELEK